MQLCNTEDPIDSVCSFPSKSNQIANLRLLVLFWWDVFQTKPIKFHLAGSLAGPTAFINSIRIPVTITATNECLMRSHTTKLISRILLFAASLSTFFFIKDEIDGGRATANVRLPNSVMINGWRMRTCDVDRSITVDLSYFAEKVYLNNFVKEAKFHSFRLLEAVNEWTWVHEMCVACENLSHPYMDIDCGRYRWFLWSLLTPKENDSRSNKL